MTDDLHIALLQVRRRLLGLEALVLAKAGGSRRGASSPRWKRAELRPVELRDGVHLQITTFDDQQAFTGNHRWGTDAERAVDELLSEPFGHWHVACTDHEYGLRVSRGGKVLVTEHSADRTQRTEHDRSKTRLLSTDAPFLSGLGITTPNGEVKKSRTSKFRQVEEFVRLVDASVRDARDAGRLRQGRLRVVDLGCGNAYLTFAAFHHMRHGLGLDVEMTGVDSKAQARQRNEALAKALRWESDLTFVESDISQVKIAEPVDIVLALHACDTATDDALARAVAWGASIVLAAPCCHHDIQRQLRNSSAPKPYGLVVRDGMLRERWADVLTDALRAALLRQHGYRTDVVEFIGSQHTPRNVMLRAQRTLAGSQDGLVEEYATLVAQWGVTPRLGELLAKEGLPGARNS